MIKAIAVDMDGTFLDSQKHYDEVRFNQQFQKLQDKNIKFIAASGNQYAKLRSIFGDKEMYFIAENGAVIYQGKSLYDYKSFDIQDYQSLVQYLMLEQGLREFIICGLKSAYILKDTSQPFKENAHFYYHQLEEIDSFNVLPDDDYVKIAFNINRTTHPTLDEDMAIRFKYIASLVSSGHDSIDVIMPSMTKGEALKGLLTKWHIKPSELMAFGDANNDKDMLALAHYSYVMANSNDSELFDIAHAVAPSNDEQGVLQVIDDVVLS